MRPLVLAFARPLLLIAALLATGRAAAAKPEAPAPLSQFTQSPEGAETPDPASATVSGYFNGIGTPGRSWDIRSDTTFSANRVFTQRFEIARAFRFNRLFSIVARINAGSDGDTTAGLYAVQGPIVSLGIRDRSLSDNYWLEFGVRLIPNWSGQNDSDPRALSLALAATLSSGAADDARWLHLSEFGYQIYGMIQSRTDPWETSAATLLVGTLYGGEASLTPLAVRSWLGPQRGVIGNAFIELFLGAPVIDHQNTSLQIGVHGEVSLSSIWPGTVPFPVLANAYVGWSPESWFALRIFGGIAGTPSQMIPTSYPYGARLEFFVP